MTSKAARTAKSNGIPFRILITATIIGTIPTIVNVITLSLEVKAQSPGIDATSAYETKSTDLGNNIKNLVILIPNEGHESQNIGDQSSDQRLINQPYVPQRQYQKELPSCGLTAM
jgi:hypothetical protein